jgi:hypothetical protein
MRWASHVERRVRVKCVHRVLAWIPVGKRPLGKPRCQWQDNIKLDLQVVGWWGMDWINVAQDRDRLQAIVSAVINLQVP